MNKLNSTFGVGIVFSALIAFTSVSRAAIIVSNLGDSPAGNTSTAGLGSSPTYAEDFMSSGPSGQINVTLDLYSSTAASGLMLNVNIYKATTGLNAGPTTFIETLGTITALASGYNDYTINSQYGIGANTPYAIEINTTVTGTALGWGYVNGVNNGGFLGAYDSSNNGGTWSTYGNQLQMEVDLVPVPEVPITGAFMGFGALAIAIGHSLRHKSSAAKNDSLPKAS